MRASDVVTQLAVLLPQFTDKLTNEIPVAALTRSGTVVTAATEAPHRLQVGDAVAITGAVTRITISSFTRSGTTGTIVTAADHDLTFKANRPVASDLPTTVDTSGATEAEFNGNFPIIAVDNRRTIRVTMADSGPTTATGSPVLQGAESALRDYNTTYPVLEAPDETHFTFTQADTTLLDPVGTIVARTKPRISAGVDPAKLIEAYTRQKIDELWLFAVLEDVAASKNRSILSDATDNIQRGQYFRQQVIQPLALYLFMPASGSIAGQAERDLAEDLFRPICRSILYTKFDSRLFVGEQGPLQFVSHGLFDYNGALYVHAFNFEQVVDLVFEDTVGPDLDVAFRDIDLTMDTNLGGTTKLTAVFPLDDVPL